MSEKDTFTTVTMNLDTKGKKAAPIIGPLIGDVRDWGDGKDKQAMLSLPTSEFQSYFEAIDALKERLGFATEHDTLQARSDMLSKVVKAFLSETVLLQEWDGVHTGDWSEGTHFECMEALLEHVSKVHGKPWSLNDVVDCPDYRMLIYYGDQNPLKTLTEAQALLTKEELEDGK